jgi:hypothetical protein
MGAIPTMNRAAKQGQGRVGITATKALSVDSSNQGVCGTERKNSSYAQRVLSDAQRAMSPSDRSNTTSAATMRYPVVESTNDGALSATYVGDGLIDDCPSGEHRDFAANHLDADPRRVLAG